MVTSTTIRQVMLQRQLQDNQLEQFLLEQVLAPRALCLGSACGRNLRYDLGAFTRDAHVQRERELVEQQLTGEGISEDAITASVQVASPLTDRQMAYDHLYPPLVCAFTLSIRAFLRDMCDTRTNSRTLLLACMDKQEGGDAGLESGRDIYQNSRPLGQSGVREQHAEATEATLASLADQGVSSVVSVSSNKSLEKEEERKRFLLERQRERQIRRSSAGDAQAGREALNTHLDQTPSGSDIVFVDRPRQQALSSGSHSASRLKDACMHVCTCLYHV